LLTVLALACRAPEPALSARERPYRPRERTYDVQHYAIALELYPEERRIEAECRVQLVSLEESLASVNLDFAGLTVEAVHDREGRALAFERSGEELSVELVEPLALGAAEEVRVEYAGTPRFGLWFAGTNAEGASPSLVFTHGQSQANHGWFPCFDDPGDRATSEITVGMPAAWIAVAPGERVETEAAAGRRREHWRMDTSHPSYLVSLVAGELTLHESRWEGVPLLFLAEPRFEPWIVPTFAETPDLLAFLEGVAGRRYPWSKYSQAAVDNFPWGGMENVSATTLTPLLLSDERGLRDQPSSALIAHEAAHQWFGDLLTCDDWSHLWLNEGFATYLALLYVESSRGADEFRAELRDAQDAYLAEDVGAQRRPTVWSVCKEPDDLFDTRAYQGGAARLHLLRFLVGDEAFFAAVRAYVAENAGRNVVTNDFRRALESASGRSLERVFDQWFVSSGFPEFHVDWRWDAENGEVIVDVEQMQEGDARTPRVFELPVEIQVSFDEHGDDRDRMFRVDVDERRERFRFPAPDSPLYVLLDPHGWIPKRVQQQRDSEEWVAMAERDADVNVRREAVLSLAQLAATRAHVGGSSELSVNVSTELLAQDTSPSVRADAATALAVAGAATARTEIERAALEDPEARVRIAALRALATLGPDPGLASLAEDAFAAGFSWGTMGAAAALLAQADPGRAFDWLRANLELDSPHDSLAGHLLRVLAEVPDTRVLDELRRWAADDALAPSARAVAIEMLGRASRDTADVVRELAARLDGSSFHVRRAALRALGRLDDPGARRVLSRYHARACTPEERRLVEAGLRQGSP